MEIPEGWGGGGANQETFHGGGMDIFWNHTILNGFIYEIVFLLMNLQFIARLIGTLVREDCQLPIL